MLDTDALKKKLVEEFKVHREDIGIVVMWAQKAWRRRLCAII